MSALATASSGLRTENERLRRANETLCRQLADQSRELEGQRREIRRLRRAARESSRVPVADAAADNEHRTADDGSASDTPLCLLELLPRELRHIVLEFSGGAAWASGVRAASRGLRDLCARKEMRDAVRRLAMGEFKRGMDLYRRTNGAVRDYAAGKALVRRAAAAGLRPARAMCFCYAWGTSQDWAKAAALCQAELDDGTSETEASGGACSWSAYWLARCYYHGDGVEEDYARAFDLYTRAAEVDGNGVAMNQLANFYRHGLCGQAVDEERALSLYKRSAEAGCCQGRYYLGLFLVNGTCGAEVDLKQALHWYEKANEQCRGDYDDVIVRVRAAIAAQSNSTGDAE